MPQISFNNLTAVSSGEVVEDAHFGAIMPSHLLNGERDGGNDQPGDNAPGGTMASDLEDGGEFDVTVEATNVSVLRWPGGTFAEDEFDYKNPNAATYVPTGETDPLDNVGMSDAIQYCSENGLGISFIMPTSPFIGGAVNQWGNSQAVISEAASIKTYIKTFLSEALAAGVPVKDIDLGNEFSFSTVGAAEYGVIASTLAKYVGGAVDEFENENTLPNGWTRPDINLQVSREFDEDGNGIEDIQEIFDGFLSVR